MELVSPASMSKGAKKIPQRCWSELGNKATSKPLFESLGSNHVGRTSENSSTVGEDDSVPVSWEDIEDTEFLQVKSSMMGANDCCSDDNPDDWFNVKPGQLESGKWSMTFHRQATTPHVQSTKPFAFSSHSAPAATSQSKHGRNRYKKPSLVLYRPDVDESGDKDSSSEVNWSQKFKARYEAIMTPYIDSHCHLDFLFKRSGFSGSFAKYRRCNANTYPSCFSGCIAVFCNPKMWSYQSEGKKDTFLFHFCLI